MAVGGESSSRSSVLIVPTWVISVPPGWFPLVSWVGVWCAGRLLPLRIVGTADTLSRVGSRDEGQADDGGTTSPRWLRYRASGGRSYAIRDRMDLDARRVARGLSQQDLARMAHCSKPMVGFLCTGHRDRVTEELARALAVALRCEPWDLVEGWVRETAGGGGGK